MASPLCSDNSDRVFGPRINTSCRALDFTLLFEDIFFACLPAAVFLSLLPTHIAVLRRSPVVCSVRTKLLVAKLTTLVCIFTTQVSFLALRTQNNVVQTRASVAADVLSIIATAGVAWLSYIDHQRSLRPSTLLSLYLSVVIILNIARVRTLWLVGIIPAEAANLTLTFALTMATFLLESTEKKSTIITEERRYGAPEEYSGFWTRTAFAWLAATFRAGYSKVIVQEDLPKIDTRLQGHILHEKLVSTYAKCKYNLHSLLKACFRENLTSFLSGIPPRLCKSVFFFAQPMLINVTVSYVGEASPDPSYGHALIGAWALVFLGIACTTGLSSYQTTRFITRVKGGLIGLIYQETMKARTVDLGPNTAVALMGTDVERIGQNLQSIHEMWASIIEVGVATWLLEQQIFLACLAPVAVIIIIVAITGPLSTAAKTAQRNWIEKVQERLRITSAMLDDMKAVKMLGLSSVMTDIVQGLRKSEIEKSEVYRKLMSWNVGLSNCVANLAPLVTFAVYVIISLYWKSGSLFTAQAFTSIALINLLTTPVLMLIQLMPSLLQCISFFDRIQEYCNYADDSSVDTSSSQLTKRTGSAISLQFLTGTTTNKPVDSTKHAIELQNNNFSWEKSKSYFLKDINLKVLPGTITVCVGVVGSGKTMLLESILGETISSLGRTSNRSATSIAYCAQQPWLENTSIRNNIIGVSHFDAAWYKTVQSACALDSDLQSLEKGDKTVVGSKGLNLSGGQKQRIALARAVYSRKEIIILDDVFSGMDAHTVDHVSRRLLGPSGLFRSRGITVILATHSHKLMSLADTIVALEDGRIVEMGSPQALQSQKGYVASLSLDVPAQESTSVKESHDSQISRVSSTVAESFISAADAIEVENKDSLDARRKNGDWSVYSYYFSSSGYFIIVCLLTSMAAWVFCTEFGTVWLDWWSGANEGEPNKNVGMYMGVYTALCLLGVAMIGVACKFAFVDIISMSAFRLHSNLLTTTMRAPLRFFTTTDTGTLTNRFSQDMELIDMNLPIIMVNYISTAFASTAKAIILVVFSRYLAATVPFVLVALYCLQSFYLQTSRQVRLLEIEAKAPLYTHFIESVAGAATIRAFGWQSIYQERNYKLIDQSQRPAYLQFCIQHWLSFVLDMLVTALAVILVAIIVTWKDKFTAGNVGVSLVMVMTFSTVLMRLIKMWTMMESSIGAVARVKRFAEETESEERDGPVADVASDWPRQGAIEFRSLVAAHGPDSEPVIKGLSMAVKQAEHIAICGRSGSGKTSLILALLQMLESQEGRILVDGVDVSTVSLTDVRSHLNVVPQDPFLLPGTIRFNIDPFGKVSDEDITRALERVHLWPIVAEQGGLGAELDVAAWSAGQKQLLCLARAMVRNSKVLILDEATSSVDSETEAIMQDIIDTVFRDCTVLAVMHRLTHIGRYDKVALLDSGHLMEFDSPASLLSQDSHFASLHRSSATRP
ncbi:hypothetical protein PFICI_13591 [Pestalotiopsis fici W106-1]|uniref:Uncharacterized protein n=1 Tax=Pestalotiopsis fici (strain W106-1 / CGMCC3.15140) TaxID=1229662 RepID=W3WPM2_PESFW|nr:uncharacterized protein PFICI_13591 [Pestalotiopsis fici W106-1]ETS75107.1 hypothetical protein PFICI_13591 [Pestalotiopsis fici W106-1]